MVVDGQTGFDEHLDGSVEGNDDQHPFSVSKGTGSWFWYYDIDVDEDVGENTVDE